MRIFVELLRRGCWYDVFLHFCFFAACWLLLIVLYLWIWWCCVFFTVVHKYSHTKTHNVQFHWTPRFVKLMGTRARHKWWWHNFNRRLVFIYCFFFLEKIGQREQNEHCLWTTTRKCNDDDDHFNFPRDVNTNTTVHCVCSPHKKTNKSEASQQAEQMLCKVFFVSLAAQVTATLTAQCCRQIRFFIK